MSASPQEHAGASSPKHHERADIESNGSSSAASVKPRIGQESFWSPKLKQQRLNYLKVMGSTCLSDDLHLHLVRNRYLLGQCLERIGSVSSTQRLDRQS